MSTAFDQMLEVVRAEMVSNSLGHGHTFALNKLPPNNTAPHSVIMGIFDGKGSSATILLSAQGIARLNEATGLLMKGVRS